MIDLELVLSIHEQILSFEQGLKGGVRKWLEENGVNPNAKHNEN